MSRAKKYLYRVSFGIHDNDCKGPGSKRLPAVTLFRTPAQIVTVKTHNQLAHYSHGDNALDDRRALLRKKRFFAVGPVQH
jgi:hypothetical protein